MAVQSLSDLKAAFAPGAVLKASLFVDTLDTVENMVGNASAGSSDNSKSLVVPVGYHDWDSLNQFTNGSGSVFPGDYNAIDIEDFINYEKGVVSTYNTTNGTDIDDAIFDSAETLSINNVDFYSYYNLGNGLYDDGSGNTVYPPLFIKCGSVIVTIPLGHSALFTRSTSSLGEILHNGDSSTDISAWLPVGNVLTTTESELADIRSQSSSSGS